MKFFIGINDWIVVEPKFGSVLGSTTLKSVMPIKNFMGFKYEFNVKLPMISLVRTHILASTNLFMGLVD